MNNDGEAPRWAVLYRMALLELDVDKLPERIREAREAIREQLKRAIVEKTRQLSTDERRSLEDALHNLQTLEERET